ncbi:hypothetical protein [Bacillus toyonensis]|nr:hypothetical protein [Bacillus toyonensis]
MLVLLEDGGSRPSNQEMINMDEIIQELAQSKAIIAAENHTSFE